MSAGRGESKAPDKTGTTLSLGETKKDRSSHFIFQPKQTLAPFLDAKSIAQLSACSRSLNENTKKIAYWKNKLITVGCPEDQIKEVISANIIQNYKKLFVNLFRLHHTIRNKITAWEIVCLSGETLAMQHFFQQGNLTTSFYTKNPLHWAAQSGSEKAIKWVIETLRIPATSTTNLDFNALHFAALSGSIEAMKYAVEKLHISATSTTNIGCNALHFAAQSGFVEAMKYAFETLQIPATSTTNVGTNALHFAAWSGSIKAIKYTIETLRISATSTAHDDRNALHLAAESGSEKAIKWVIETLRIPATSTATDGSNALHFAAQSESVEAMKYVFETLQTLHIPATSTRMDGANALLVAARYGSIQTMKYASETLHIPATSTTSKGANALHCAAQNGFVKAMKYAFETLQIPASSTTNVGTNALHFAAWSGSIKAIKYTIETLKISAASTTTDGANVLHFAAWGGSIEAMKYVIETLKIPATSTTNNGINALHFAASGEVAAVRYLRILSYKFNLGLEPTTLDVNGHDVFWHAALGQNSAEIQKILYLPIDRILNPPDPNENYWRTAKVASSLAAGAAVGCLKGVNIVATATTVYGISAAVFVGACTVAGAGLLLLIAYCINCYRTGYSGFFSSVLTSNNEQSEMKQERLVITP